MFNERKEISKYGLVGAKYNIVREGGGGHKRLEGI